MQLTKNTRSTYSLGSDFYFIIGLDLRKKYRLSFINRWEIQQKRNNEVFPLVFHS